MKAMSQDSIPLSQIDSDFTDETEPKDETLLALLKQAYTGQILCQNAMIAFEKIKVFSDFQPVISEQFRNHFVQRLKQAQPPLLYVYPKADAFIMSDDYQSYYLYKEYKISQVPCVVLGAVMTTPGVAPIGEPYQLPTPSVEII